MIIREKVFKNGPIKICGRQPLKKLKGYDLTADELFECVWRFCGVGALRVDLAIISILKNSLWKLKFCLFFVFPKSYENIILEKSMFTSVSRWEMQVACLLNRQLDVLKQSWEMFVLVVRN